MASDDKDPTPPPVSQRQLDRLQADFERHRVMKGHPPTGKISQPQPEHVTRRRIKELKERAKQFNQMSASRTKQSQVTHS